MLTEILRREPSALGLDGARGRLRCATAARPHPFSLVVRTCRPVGKRGGALLRICPPLVYLIIVRMLARPAFADSIKCSPSPWADKSSISRSRGSAPSYFPLRKSRFFRRFPLVTRGGKSGKISRFFFEPKSLPQFVPQNPKLCHTQSGQVLPIFYAPGDKVPDVCPVGCFQPAKDRDYHGGPESQGTKTSTKCRSSI